MTEQRWETPKLVKMGAIDAAFGACGPGGTVKNNCNSGATANKKCGAGGAVSAGLMPQEMCYAGAMPS